MPNENVNEMKIIDDISALEEMRLISRTDEAKSFQVNKGPYICNGHNRSACDIINDLLPVNKWLACEALANMKAIYNTQPYIYEKNREIYDSIKEDIDDWFNYNI